MKITIQSFAELKEYFNPEIFLEVKSGILVADLLQELQILNPKAKPALLRSRIAIDMKFVSTDFKIKENDVVCIIPPSSGG